MREARRVDLRNGVNIKHKIEVEEQKWRDSEKEIDQVKQSLGNIILLLFHYFYHYYLLFIIYFKIKIIEDIRMNPDILDILERKMYEMTPLELGNWGR